MRTFFRNGGFALLAAAVLAHADTTANKPPVISHDPVTVGVVGQPITLKAKVEDAAPGVDHVTLYYALFRDAAPFKLPMRPTGLNFFVATVDAGVLSGVDKLAYYIEAQDKDGALAETPWYNVEFRKPDPSAAVEPPGPAAQVQPTTTEGKSSALTVGLIAGGAAAVIGGVLLATSGGGDDDGGDSASTSGTTTNTAAKYTGTYNGDATICLTVTGSSPACENHPATIVVDSKGSVVSDNLLPGRQMTGKMSGNSFTLSGSPTTAGVTGTIYFNGTVVDNRIVGNISGGVSTPSGPGSYSGTFTAAK